MPQRATRTRTREPGAESCVRYRRRALANCAVATIGWPCRWRFRIAAASLEFGDERGGPGFRQQTSRKIKAGPGARASASGCAYTSLSESRCFDATMANIDASTAPRASQVARSRARVIPWSRTCFGSGTGRVVRCGATAVAVVEGTEPLAHAGRLAGVSWLAVLRVGLVEDSDATSL